MNCVLSGFSRKRLDESQETEADEAPSKPSTILTVEEAGQDPSRPIVGEQMKLTLHTLYTSAGWYTLDDQPGCTWMCQKARSEDLITSMQNAALRVRLTIQIRS